MIRLETDDSGIASIVLNRPEQRNALTLDMLEKIPMLAREAAADGARSLLLRGEGRVFCAGFDLRLCTDDPEGGAMRSLLSGLSETIVSLRNLEIPVVLACHGAAIAGGCALLGGVDLVVADRGAKLGYPVVKIGVSPAVSAPFLGRAIGQGACRERLLDPELISGERAFTLGLVHELVETREQVRAAAETLAHRLGDKPRAALRETKRWLDRVGGPSERETREALGVSVGLTGSEEERKRIAAIWGDAANGEKRA